MDENRKINICTKMKLLHFIVLYLIFKEINCTTTPHWARQKLYEGDSSGKEDEELSYDEIMLKEGNNTAHDRFCGFEETHHKFIDINKNIQMTGIVWIRTKVGEESIIPLCSIENGLPLRRRCLLRKGRRPESEWDHLNDSIVLTDCSTSMFCPAEEFQHYVIDIKGYSQERHNIWKRTQIGELSNLGKLCLQSNGSLLTRKCLYDAKNYKAIWAPVDHLKGFKCLQYTRQRIISNDLNILYDRLNSSRNVMKRRHTATTLLTLLEKPKIKFLPGDVQITIEILKNIVSDSHDVVLSKYVFKIALNLMAVDPLVLRMSANVSATNRLLKIFENYMDNLTKNSAPNALCKVSKQPLNSNNSTININNITLPTEILNFRNIGVYAQIDKNLSVFFVNPDCANISGIAIYTFHQYPQGQWQKRHRVQAIHYDSHNDFYYRFIFMNESINDLLNELNVEVASFIPARLWTNLKLLYPSPTRIPQIVFKIYTNDSLFVEEGLFHLHEPFSKILSISIPGFKKQLPENLSFILRSNNISYKVTPNSNTSCGYWNYSTWVRNGVATDLILSKPEYGLILCSTDHLAQFALLKTGGFYLTSIENMLMIISNQRGFDRLSIFGCIFTLLALLGTSIKTMFFDDLCSKPAIKFLINMYVAIALEMVLLLVINTYDVSGSIMEQQNYAKCIVLGAIIQYTCLALFIWQITALILQYNFYVKILHFPLSPRYFLISAATSWLVPLIPTLLMVRFDWESFIPNNEELAIGTGICFPSGFGFYFGLFVPICFIFVLNSIILGVICFYISNTNNNESAIQLNEKKKIWKQIYLFILSFFLISLSWVFGLYAFTETSTLLAVLFCITAPSQVIVLLKYFKLWSPFLPVLQVVGIELEARQ